jgi:predicted TIM-barrel fold metal-dependent hydrolase
VLTKLSPITTGVISNEAIAEFCLGHEALIPVANINPFMVSNPVQESEQYVREMGFRGFKLTPPIRASMLMISCSILSTPRLRDWGCRS